MPREFPAAQPHGAFAPIFEDAWYLTGSVAFKPLLRLPRNMVVLPHEGELTLVNSIRLDADGEAALDALGQVAHVVRIGFHGMDDDYYLDRYGATAWVVPGAASGSSAASTRELSEDVGLPIPDAQVFRFKHTVKPEAAILIERGGGLLITCDSVQHWAPSPLMSPLAKVVTRLIGFQKPAQIGPPWRKKQTPQGGSLGADFSRLASLSFERLIGGHGGLLESGAASELAKTIERELPSVPLRRRLESA